MSIVSGADIPELCPELTTPSLCSRSMILEPETGEENYQLSTLIFNEYFMVFRTYMFIFYSFLANILPFPSHNSRCPSRRIGTIFVC